MDRPLSSRKLAAGAVKLKTLRPVGKQPDFVFVNQIAGASNCHVESARGSSVYMQTYESGALNNR